MGKTLSRGLADLHVKVKKTTWRSDGLSPESLSFPDQRHLSLGNRFVSVSYRILNQSMQDIVFSISMYGLKPTIKKLFVVPFVLRKEAVFRFGSMEVSAHCGSWR